MIPGFLSVQELAVVVNKALLHNGVLCLRCEAKVMKNPKAIAVSAARQNCLVV
jgi:hypothetical protein